MTAPTDCVIEVEAWCEGQWGFAGGTATLEITGPPGLSTLANITGLLWGGDVVGRTLHAKHVFAGARAGARYAFTADLRGSGADGDKQMYAVCRPS